MSLERIIAINPLAEYYNYIVEEIIGEYVPFKLKNGGLNNKQSCLHVDREYASIIEIPKNMIKRVKTVNEQYADFLNALGLGIKKQEFTFKKPNWWWFNIFERQGDYKIENKNGLWQFKIVHHEFDEKKLGDSYFLFDSYGYIIDEKRGRYVDKRTI